MNRKIAIAILLITPFALFGPRLGFPFTNWDDPALIVQNHRIQGEPLPGLFVPENGYWYQPLRDLSHAVDWRLWGESPAGHRAVNVLLHALSAVLLFLVIRLLLADKSNIATAAAFGTALLFIVHPVNVEPVIWIAGREFGLFAFFLFAATYCWLRPGRGWLAGACGLALLAMLSSPLGAVLPLLWISLRAAPRPAARSIYQLLPLAAVAVLLLGLVVRDVAAIAEAHAGGGSMPFHALGLAAVHLVLPSQLCAVYPTLDIPAWAMISGVLVVATVIFCVRRKHAGAAPLLWFAAALLPALCILPLDHGTGDRHLYIAAIGPFAMFATWLARRGDRFVLPVVALILCAISWQRSAVWRSSQTLWEDAVRKHPRHDVSLLNLGTALMAVGKDQEALAAFDRVITVNPNHRELPANRMKVLLNLGRIDNARELDQLCASRTEASALEARACFAFAMGQWEQASKLYAEALELDPRNSELLVHRATALARHGDPEAARELLQGNAGNKSIQLARADLALGTGNFAAARELYGQFPDDLSAAIGLLRIRLAEGDSTAADEARALAAKNPTVTDAQRLWVMAESENADPAAQEKAYLAAIRADSSALDLRLGVGDMYRTHGAMDLAAGHYRQFIAAGADHVLVPYVRGMLAICQSDWATAVEDLEQAIAAQPNSLEANLNLGGALFQLNRLREALQAFTTATELAPASVTAWANRGTAELRLKEYKNSRISYRRTLELDPDHADAKRMLELLNQAFEHPWSDIPDDQKDQKDQKK